ncbi:hypothetical protein MBANPS3_004549 [Mucor bainieri]
MAEEIQDYMSKKTPPYKLSEFIADSQDVVVNVVRNEDITNWKDLKAYWCRSTPDMMVADKNSVDWSELFDKCQKSIRVKQVFSDISNNEVAQMEQAAKQYVGNKKKESLRKTVGKWISKEGKKQKDDLLHEDILDLISDEPNTGTRRVLKNGYEDMLNQYTTHHKYNKAIKKYVRSILTAPADPTQYHQHFKSILHKEKRRLQQLPSSQEKKMLKLYLNVCRLFKSVVNPNMNLLNQGVSEPMYTYYFVFPLVRLLLKQYDSELMVIVGEPYLNAKKKEENALLTENQRSAQGPKIDIIIHNKTLDLEIALVEISGPNRKANKAHYLGDRNKLAANMKSIYRDITHKNANNSRRSSKNLKVFGFQFYLDTIYMYSLCRGSDGFYVFVTEYTLQIPTSNNLLHALPTFIAEVMLMRDLIAQTNRFLISYMFDDEDSTDSNQSSNLNKKQKHTH